MSFPRYPKYKPSGVEWLGDVPEGWEVQRSDSFLTYSRAQLDPKEFHGLEVFHYSIPAVQETGTGQLEQGSELASGKQVVKKRVVLVSKLNPRKGTICIAEPQQALTLCSTEFVALEPKGCDISYLSYLVKTEAFRQGLESKVTSVTNSHQRANPVDIYRFWNAWPDLAEQTAIAEFLDRETGKIDELVAEQRRLMELLKEKRQAVISHAVTQGLNPHAPMKPSGIEWLGDVPAHWIVGPVKRFFKSWNTRRIPLSGEERGLRSGVYPYYGASGIIDHIDEFIFDQDLVLVSEDGANLLNRASPIAFVATGKYWVNNHAHILQPLDSNLLFWAARIESIDITPFVTGSAQPKFTSEALGALIISAPPEEVERAQIESHIVVESAKFDALTAEAQRAIDLLQERRTALISAAVTGQIDVRNHSPEP